MREENLKPEEKAEAMRSLVEKGIRADGIDETQAQIAGNDWREVEANIQAIALGEYQRTILSYLTEVALSKNWKYEEMISLALSNATEADRDAANESKIEDFRNAS